MPAASVRIYVLLARRSPSAVIFRRGPSSQVLTLAWDTSDDTIRPGQWFRGRIYERRCDLSPSGEKLIYFAAKHRPPYGTWTAVSRPPYLTALALWPKGDAWGGGGLFANERTIELNHPVSQSALAPEFRLPRSISVVPHGARSGAGEDDPLLSARLTRDGWKLADEGEIRQESSRAPVSWTFPRHQVWQKRRGGWTLEMRLLGMHERDGAWYVLEHRLLDASGTAHVDFGRSDWADWARDGDVLLAREGRLYRLPIGAEGPGALREIADLRPMKFHNVEPPPGAKQWSGRASDSLR